MVEPNVFHLVIALRVWQRVIGLAEVPLTREVGVVAALLEHRCERPFRLGQSAALALECYGGHAAAVRNAPGLHRRAPRRAARLGIERKEGHPFVGHLVEIGRRHAAPFPPAVHADVAVAVVVGNDEQDVGFALLSHSRKSA